MSKIKDPVNLPLGDLISVYAGKLTRTTHGNSIWVDVDKPDDHFRSEISFSIINHLPNIRMIIAPDGNGTKVLLSDAACFHRKSAYDLGAMTSGDITRNGGLPVVFSNVLDVSKLGDTKDDKSFLAAQALFDGLVEVANKGKFACIKGETAELSVCVSSPNPAATLKYNWSGFMIGIIHPDKRITGETLASGQVIIALKENGFRSNGISAVRATMEKQFGPEWWQQKELVEKIAEPSVLYDYFLASLNGWYNIDNNFEHYIKPHLICHLSGGSFKSKFFDDVLKRKGLSAKLHNLWEPPSIVADMARWSGFSDELLYEKWSCGQGALVVVDSNEADSFITHATQFGIQARVAGVIEERSTSQLLITSKFSGNTFVYK